MIVFLWIMLILSIGTVGLAMAVMAWLSGWARKGKSGSEYFAMALAPLFHASTLLMYVGGISGVLLAVLLDGTGVRVTTGALGGILLAFGVLPIVFLFRGRRTAREKLRVITQQEMVELIRSRAVKGFWKDGEVVRFNYTENWDENGEFIWRTTYADPKGYPAYVAEANDVRHRTGHAVTYPRSG